VACSSAPLLNAYLPPANWSTNQNGTVTSFACAGQGQAQYAKALISQGADTIDDPLSVKEVYFSGGPRNWSDPFYTSRSFAGVTAFGNDVGMAQPVFALLNQAVPTPTTLPAAPPGNDNPPLVPTSAVAANTPALNLNAPSCTAAAITLAVRYDLLTSDPSNLTVTRFGCVAVGSTAWAKANYTDYWGTIATAHLKYNGDGTWSVSTDDSDAPPRDLLNQLITAVPDQPATS
jgi:hypothetical protein